LLIYGLKNISFNSLQKEIVVRYESLRSRVWHNQVSLPTDPHSEFAYRSSSQVVTDKALEKKQERLEKKTAKK